MKCAYIVRSPSIEIDVIPNPNIPVGPESGILGKTVNFTVGGAKSNRGHELEYQIDWGDSSLSNWNNEAKNHIYQTCDTFYVKTRARCKVDTMIISDWSAASQINIVGLKLEISIYPELAGIVTKNPDKNQYALSDSVLLTSLANSGYEFDHWDGDLTGGDNPAKIIMDENKSITAFFNQLEEIVTRPTSVTGPSIGVMGQSLKFTTEGAVSNLENEVEYQFDWGDGIFSNWGVNTMQHTYFVVDSMLVRSRARSTLNYDVVSDWSDVHLVMITGYSLTIHIIPQGAGVITKDPDNLFYADSWPVKLSALALTGFRFDHWSGDISGQENPKTILMDENKNITANFAKTQDSISTPKILIAPDSGVVNKKLLIITGGAVSNSESTIEYQFDWGDGSFSEWGDSSREHSYNSVGIKGIKSRARLMFNKSIVSLWSKSKNIFIYSLNYRIDITVEPEGAGFVKKNPSKNEYNNGDTVILSPIPEVGYVFDYWSGDLNGIDNPAYLVINKNIEIIAHFKKISAVENYTNKVPSKFLLFQNYPNPLNPETIINYQIAKDCEVQIAIFDVQGKLINTLTNEYHSAGYYTIRWHAVDIECKSVRAGLFLYKIKTKYFT